MKIEFEVVDIKVIQSDMMDEVFIHTTSPNPFNPNFYKGPLVIQFKCTRNTGAQYIRDNYGFEPEIIDTNFDLMTNTTKE